ncbi:MAG TPA: signal peptidase I [Candidatus Paceibacterota bacterium]|nr:signal peptidase I [Verrucomicrobiota bacterium]HSA12006.1 signal peptidase I [Candidatus Paceibacterota bacterium]
MATSNEAGPGAGWLQRVLIGRNPKRTVVRIVVLAAVSLIVFRYVLLPVRVDGGSMLPTYRENGVNLVNRLAYLFREPQRGDVVAVRLLAGGHRMYLKRIVAMPGETLVFHGGRILVNGKLLEEPYVKFPCDWEHEPVLVGPDQYYVVGDNRDNQRELHAQGRAPRALILGKVLL